MSADATDSKPHELIIVRRRGGGDHDGGHGGSVWKIAYADFMTAMMAFFLVMWLINSADKEQLTAVASYFNPVKLTDPISNPKGLHDMNTGARGDEDKPGESLNKQGSSKGDPRAEVGPKAKYPEDVLFSDPYGILAKLAALATVEKAVQDKGQAEAVHQQGDAFRDPFDPEFRSNSTDVAALQQAAPQQTEPPLTTIADILDAAGIKSPVAEKGASETSTQSTAGQQRLAAGELKTPGDTSSVSSASGAKPEAVEAKPAAQQRAGEQQVAAVAPSADDKAARAESDKDRTGKAESPPAVVVDPGLEEQIKHALKQSAPGAMPHVEVKGTSEGILISLTDEFDFGMFAISSAEPKPETVVLMERIAKILAERPEQIVVRGHTDGRPFRTQTYDNWRLSSARAHMAYYMLVRGGITEKRFERIEGHADRTLKVAGEPEAAQNRRIEILLRKGHAS